MSAENAAKDSAPTTVVTVALTVALVSIPRVLRIALIVALYKTLTKCLRRGVLKVARSLGIVILSALTITRARVQALLIPTVDFILIISTVVAVATVSAILTVVVDLTVVAVDLTIVAVDLIIIPAVVGAIVAASMPVPIPVLTVALTTLIIAVAILGLSGAGCRSKYSKDKCERQKSPANPFSKFFHVRKSPLPGETIGKLYAFASQLEIVGFAGFVPPFAY
jgi:hypothetical protein